MTRARTRAHAGSGASLGNGGQLTAVQVAGDGGMGEDEVVDVGVLLEWRYISSSMLP